MKGVRIGEKGIIEFYGNKAGFIRENTAYMDPMFQTQELKEYLTEEHGFKVNWQEGLYDKLINGLPVEMGSQKQCRIYQLKPDSDVQLRFIGMGDLERLGFGKPQMKNYEVVFDGSLGTDDLEEIYERLNTGQHPKGYSGHSLSISDVVELYDETGSGFYYVDRFGFAKISFHEQTKELQDQPISKPVPDQEAKSVPESIPPQKESDPEPEPTTYTFTM